MFDYQVSKHPHFDEACRAFALRHNLVQLAERAGMNVQILRNKLNPAQPHLLTAPEIWLLTDLTEDSTLVDGFLAQIHCLPCVPINEVAKEKLPHYVMSATAEIGRVAAGAVMADAMDLVQQRVEEERQRHIRAARAKTPGVSRVLCIECEAPIPPARRRAIPGVQLCITCQEIAELKGKHYNGGAV
ncbi:phage regulatory CII family protein [Escherichia coli]|nr:phage regulatory CII family protein [Escherichia coli]